MDVLYLQRDGVLEEQEEVSIMKVSHGETGNIHDAIGCVELWGNEGPRFQQLQVMRKQSYLQNNSHKIILCTKINK